MWQQDQAMPDMAAPLAHTSQLCEVCSRASVQLWGASRVLFQSPQFINTAATHPFPPFIFRILIKAACVWNFLIQKAYPPPPMGSSCRSGSTPFLLRGYSLFPPYELMLNHVQEGSYLIPWYFLTYLTVLPSSKGTFITAGKSQGLKLEWAPFYLNTRPLQAPHSQFS